MSLLGSVGLGTAWNAGKGIVSSGLDALGIGTNRGSKREKRGKLQNQLENAGVHPDAVDNVHSDDWRELKKLADFIKQNGKMAVAYLNETMPRSGFGGKKGQTAAQVTRNFSSWKRSKQPPTQQGQSGGGSSSSNQGNQITNIMLIAAAAIAAFFFFGRNVQA